VSLDLVGEKEIADRLRVQPGTVHQWRKRDLLPEPMAEVSGMPVWEWSTIDGWARATGRLKEAPADPVDVLPGAAPEVLEAIGRSVLGRDFHLVGGTALALQLRHRISRDLDFFSTRPTESISRARILNVVARLFRPGDYRVTLQSEAQIDLVVKGVRVTFLAWPFRTERPLLTFGSARIADPEDIVGMKAYSIGRRAVARDYIDIYFALRSGVISMDGLVEKAKRVYVLDGEQLFDAALFAGQLTYTDDLEGKEVSITDVLDGKTAWDNVEAALAEAGESWLRDHVVGDSDRGVNDEPSRKRS
jgi:predicted nucleotidyltransferase component of viral defense system